MLAFLAFFFIFPFPKISSGYFCDRAGKVVESDKKIYIYIYICTLPSITVEKGDEHSRGAALGTSFLPPGPPCDRKRYSHSNLEETGAAWAEVTDEQRRRVSDP